MGFVMFLQEGQTCPMILCDYCQKPIEDINDGVTVYPDHDFEDGVTFIPLFAHNGKCHEAIEENNDNIETGNGGWQPLSYDIHWLLKNIKFKPLEKEPYSLG